MIYAILGSFIILDVISGFTKAVYQNNVQSKIMRQGILHKFSYIVILALAYLIDYAGTYFALGFPAELFMITSGFVCVTETLSIIENVLAVLPDDIGQGLRSIFNIHREERIDS